MIVLAFFLLLSPQVCKVMLARWVENPFGQPMQKLGYVKNAFWLKNFTFQVTLIMTFRTVSDSHQENLTFMSNIPLLPQLRSHFTLSLLKTVAPSSFFKTWWVYYHIRGQDSQTEDSSWQTILDRLSAPPFLSSSTVVSCSHRLLLQLLPFLYIKQLLLASKGITHF